MTGSGTPSGSWSRIVATRMSHSGPSAGASTGSPQTMSSIVQAGSRSGADARAPARPASSGSVVPGRTRQSTSTTASPGMTLYLTPAWMTSGLTRVADERPQGPRVHRVAQRRRAPASASGPSLAAQRSGAGPRRRVRAGAAAAASRNRLMTGVRRIGPGTASRSTIRAASTAALSVARHRPVAPGATDVDPVRREALLGDLDRVEPLAGDRRRTPRRTR